MNRLCLAGAILALSAALLAAPPAGAQTTPGQIMAPQGSEGVAAVVNQEAITFYDLNQRIALAELSSNQPDSPELHNQLKPQMLRRLVDEHLETQDAAAKKVAVPDADVDDAIAAVERQNQMQPGQLADVLSSHGIDPATFRAQLRAQLIWNQLVRQVLLPRIEIGDDEIDARLAQLKANQGKPEYLGADIFLPIDDPTRAQEVAALAQRLYDELSQGASFIALAQQFSQFGATTGGDMGWVSPGMIDDQLIAVLAKLDPGAIAPPLRLADGIHILTLRAKRIAGQGDDNEATYDLAAIDMTSLPSASPGEVQQQIDAAKHALAGAKTCDDYSNDTQHVTNANFSRLGVNAESDMPASVLAMVRGLQPGQMTSVVNSGTLHRIYVVCAFTPASKGMPSRDDLRRELVSERIEALAEGYLRDLRRSAFIEIRS